MTTKTYAVVVTPHDEVSELTVQGFLQKGELGRLTTKRRVYRIFAVNGGLISSEAFNHPVSGDLLIAIHGFPSEAEAKAWVSRDVQRREPGVVVL